MKDGNIPKSNVTVAPINHVCMYGTCIDKAVPEKTVRVGSTHYHYCQSHG